MWMLTFALCYIHVFSSIWFLSSGTAYIFITTKTTGTKQVLKKLSGLKLKSHNSEQTQEAVSFEHVQTSSSPGSS